MIKFFRKIRQNLLMENKTGKYFKYAIGEIVLVVIGILIALQINTWNENKKTLKKETIILNSLNKDFKINLKQFKDIKQKHLNNFEGHNIILRNLDNLDDAVIKDSIIKFGNTLLGGYTFDASNGVIESLIYSGDINIISNDTLKNYLVSWKDVLKDYQEEEDFNRELWSNIIMPYIIINGDFNNVKSLTNYDLLRDSIFVNMIARRRHMIGNIINEIEIPNSIEHYLNEIIRLSNTK